MDLTPGVADGCLSLLVAFPCLWASRFAHEPGGRTIIVKSELIYLGQELRQDEDLIDESGWMDR